MRNKWAWRLTGLALAATAGVALSRAPQESPPPIVPDRGKSPAGTALARPIPAPPPHINSAGGPAIPPTPAPPIAPEPHTPFGVSVTENCPTPAFARALRAEAEFQFDQQSRNLFAGLSARVDPIPFPIDLPLKDPASVPKQFAHYLSETLPVAVCETLVRDRESGASAWLAEGLANFAFATPGRKLELDAECRRRLGEGRALPLTNLLATPPPVDRDAEAQHFSLVAFLAQRRLGMTGKQSWDDKGYFVKKLIATDKLARQGGPNPAAWEWGFQDADEMQAAWIAWLKRPESRPDWKPELDVRIPTIPAAEKSASRTIPPTNVGAKPVDDLRIPPPLPSK